MPPPPAVLALALPLASTEERPAPQAPVQETPEGAHPRVLLVGGSLNQTTMMHRIGAALEARGCAAVYTPFYADGLIGRLAAWGWFDFSILGGQARRRTDAYLAAQRLPTDLGGADGPYDLVVMGTDLYLPANVRGRPIVLVQEGMMDPETWRYRVFRHAGLFRA
ncbi:MAG TPA: hypothetical protein VK610_05760, partial [Rhodothermales bacterium]|nr:hypothetical protein [Rhodothermales bacterium]